ncbi:zinc finger protein 700-like [Sycon ciliatum]|uniref:zinc finger protein 700-like n=1 Tax=Sycon ciliatum TaxID=27933 RepID=UPI0031F62308
MEDLEESMSDCSVDSNKLPPMPPLMKSKRNMRDHTSREHGPSSVLPCPASNLLEKNMEKASCMRSASLGKREDTSNIPPEYTSSLIPVSTPPLIRWTRNTIHSGSTSNRRSAFEQTFRTAYESERDETISSTPSDMDDVVNWTSAVSGYEKRASPVRSYPQFAMDALTPATASNTGVSAGRTPEIWEKPDACDMPVGHRRPIRPYSDSSMAQNQVSQKRSKNKTSQRCQYCQKEFKTVSHLRVHERVHTGDRPFKCDVCGKSFTQSCSLCAHKRTHTGDRPFKCDICGKFFTQSGNLRVHKRIHTGERPHKCKTRGISFTHSSSLRRLESIHSA